MKKFLIFLALFMIMMPVAFANEYPGDVENVELEIVEDGIKITWDATTDDVAVTGYQIHYGTSPVIQSGQTYDTYIDVGDVLEHIFSDLTVGETYYFSVVAYDEEGFESLAWSPEVNVQVPDPNAEEQQNQEVVEAPPGLGIDLSGIDKVENLQVEHLDDRVELSWDPVDFDGNVGYEIEYVLVPILDGGSTGVVIQTEDVNEYEIEGLDGGTYRSFAVRAFDRDNPENKGEYSEDVEIFIGDLGYYADITNDLYKRSINYLTEKGIVRGYDREISNEGNSRLVRHFGAGLNINRAELLKIVVESRFYGYDDSTLDKHHYQKCFEDILVEEWYTKYVCYAKEVGWVQGYEGDLFKPDQSITVVEAMKIVLKAYGMDYGQSDPWYKAVVEEAWEGELIPLTIDEFERPILRGEMADLVARKMARIHGDFYDLFGQKLHSLIWVSYNDILEGELKANEIYFDEFGPLVSDQEGTITFTNSMSGVSYEISEMDYPDIFEEGDWRDTTPGAIYLDGYIYFSIMFEEDDFIRSKIVKLYVEDEIASGQRETFVYEYVDEDDYLALLAYDLANELIVFRFEENMELSDPDLCFTPWRYVDNYAIKDSISEDFVGYIVYYPQWWKAVYEIDQEERCRSLPGNAEPD